MRLSALTATAALIGSAASAATKIMALGDSITGSPGCWRAYLWQQLVANGATNIDFVGTLAGQGCGFTYDGENEGHGGYLATGIVSQNLLPGWLSATTPDIVIMTLGTNDVWSSLAPATILAAFSTLVDQIRASKPTMKIGVAKILPMNPTGCTDCPARVVAFNAAIPAWATNKTTSASPITVVDLWTGFDTATDTYDGVHPNDAGIQKIWPKWYSYLFPLVSGGTTTSTSTTTTQTTTSTSSSSTTSSGGCTPVAKWGQCGGASYTGCTTCVSGSTCTYSNEWYSQCL